MGEKKKALDTSVTKKVDRLEIRGGKRSENDVTKTGQIRVQNMENAVEEPSNHSTVSASRKGGLALEKKKRNITGRKAGGSGKKKTRKLVTDVNRALCEEKQSGSM